MYYMVQFVLPARHHLCFTHDTTCISRWNLYIVRDTIRAARAASWRPNGVVALSSKVQFFWLLYMCILSIMTQPVMYVHGYPKEFWLICHKKEKRKEKRQLDWFLCTYVQLPVRKALLYILSLSILMKTLHNMLSAKTKGSVISVDWFWFGSKSNVLYNESVTRMCILFWVLVWNEVD